MVGVAGALAAGAVVAVGAVAGAVFESGGATAALSAAALGLGVEARGAEVLVAPVALAIGAGADGSCSGNESMEADSEVLELDWL
jgi:hypothetical protein